MGDEIIIERMKISERPQVLDFLRRAYPDNPRQSDPQFWNWHFTDLPNVDQGLLPVWLAKSGDRIAGQLGVLTVDLNIGDRQVTAFWLLDMIVDEDFRRRGIAKQLSLAVERDSPYLLGVNTDQQHAPKLLQSLGWVKVAKIPRYHKILFPGNSLKGVSQKVVNFLASPLRPSSAKTLFESGTIRFVRQFDSAFDELWQRGRKQQSCSVTRNAEMLKWQFSRQPGKQFDVLGFYTGNRLCGYVVLFFRKPGRAGSIEKGAISDIFYEAENSREIVDSLIKGALEIAIERRAGGLVADAMDPLLEERFRRYGFWKVNSQLQLMAKSPDDQALVYDPKSWFLTRGDSDISIFEDYNI
jgi:GNAT superfamily N-acetyltransferase